MNSPTRDATISALADVLRETLEDGQAVDVNGLGTFLAEHHAASVEREPDGELVMQPPKNVVTFRPASDLS